MARTMGGLVSASVKGGLLAGSNILTSLRGRFAGFFADGGPLKKLGSSIGTTVTSMGKRIGSAITKGVFSSGGRGIGSKFALLFSVLGTFSSKLSGLYNAAVPAMRTALQKAVSLLPKSVQKLLPEAFRTVMKAPTRITSSMRTALSSMKGVTLKSATVATAVVPKVIKGIVDMAPEGAGGKASKIIAAATAPIVKPAAKLSQSALNALRGTGQVTGRGITSVGQSFINRFPRLKMALKIPIIGPVLTGVFGAAILNDPNLDDTQKKKELGKLVGGQIGAAGFAVIGAALGAPAAGVGGFFSGAALGLTGYFAGEWLGGKMMDWILGDNSVGGAADQAFLDKNKAKMKSRPLLNTPAMRSSFYDANAMGPKLIQAYNYRGDAALYLRNLQRSLATSDGEDQLSFDQGQLYLPLLF